MSDTAPAATAARAIAAALLRHALTFLGAWLVRKGYVDQSATDSAIGPIGDYVLGAALTLGSAGWGMLRARAAHWRWIQALYDPALRPADANQLPRSGLPSRLVS